jgi:C_GCAxxG_C_C family probable redox protein
MNRAETTIDLQMNGGLNCAQAIMTVFGESLGLSPDAAKVLGRPWGGGMAQQGMTCGYLTGAILVLAQAFGDQDEEQSGKQLGQAVRSLFSRFEERRGATLCKELLGADMSTEEGVQKIKEEGLVKRLCCSPGGISQDVAEILEKLISCRSS